MFKRFLQKFRELANLRPALELVWESARGWTIASLILMVLQALLPLITLFLIKLTVDAVTAGIGSPDKTAAIREILFLIFLTALVSVFIASCRALAGIVEEHQSQLVTDHIMDIIHSHSVDLDLSYYEDYLFHDTFYRTQREAPHRPTQIVRNLTNLTQSTISFIALAGLLIYLHWLIALLLFIAALPGIFVKASQSNRLYNWYKSRTETERRSYEYHNMLTNIYHAKEVRLFDLGSIFRERYRALRSLLRGERMDLAKKRAKADLAVQGITTFTLFGMVAYIGWQTIQGVMTIGDMVMYQQAFQRAQTAIQGIIGGLAGLYENNLFLKNFYAFLELKPIIVEPENNPLSPPKPMKEGIKFAGVSFSYPGMNKEVLSEINFSIPSGKIVAIVGENGAGKTTIAKMLCRLYDPIKGKITMDGIPYQSYDVYRLRREIAVIFQDYVHYPFSVRENIWVGDVATDPQSEKIIEAAKKAGADKLIKSLSKGYETTLGRQFEGGEEISIGEWQKIALSRAFLRDAQLIILDEPTSTMSVKAEYELFQSFRELLAGHSALLISHRFSTVQMADLIYVLEEGRIIEQGSHKELLDKKGRYAALFEMQARYYC